MHTANHKPSSGRKYFLLIVSLLLISVLTIGGTFAWLSFKTGPVNNSFAKGSVPIVPEEKLDGQVKKSVTIQNTGNFPALIRLSITANRIDEAGNIIGGDPIFLPVNSNDWDCVNGFYYYKGIVQPNGETSNLFTQDVDYTGMEINIMAQSVQASGNFGTDENPVSPSQYAWNMNYDPAAGVWTEA